MLFRSLGLASLAAVAAQAASDGTTCTEGTGAAPRYVMYFDQ